MLRLRGSEELMLSSLIAERYAKALLRAADAEKALAAVGAQAEGLAEALKGADGAERFLVDPLAEPGAKLAVLNAAFGDAPHPVMQSFLRAVLEHKRERFLPLILASFLQMRDAAEGRVNANLGTARPLAPAEVKLLEKELGKRLGREVTLQPYTEKEMLGGAVLRLGDTVYDASLRSRLLRLGRLLTEGPPRPKRAPESPATGAAKSKSGRSKPTAKAPAAKAAGSAKKKVTQAKPAKPAKAAAKPAKAKPAKAGAAAKAKPAKAKAKAAKPAKAKTAKPAKAKGASSAGQALAAKLLKKDL
jgi:F-type H+-transporting ATPase subunit delta